MSSNAEEADATTAPHLDWASRIKSQHYHLQQCFASQRKQSNAANSDGHDNAGDVIDDAELRLWQSALAAPGEEARLRTYATAMHHLATKYWEAPLAKAMIGESGTPCAPCKPSTDLAPEKAGLHCAGGAGEKAGRKRPRNVGDADRDDLPVSAVQEDALQRRLYNDRVDCTLTCVKTFFLGTPHTPATPPSAMEGKEGNNVQSNAAPLYDVFPLLLSRTLKPLRRQFFQEHRRVATDQEVHEMVATMAMTGVPSERLDSKIRVATPTAWDRVMEYTRVLAAVAAKAGDARGSGEKDAERQACQVPNSPSALRVLDVGSCYGPFFGKVLRVPVLGEVPLAVTAIDLCPYEEVPQERAASGASTRAGPAAARGNESASRCYDGDGEAQTTNARVLKGDWLSLTFFPPQPLKKSEASPGCLTTAHGRVRLQGSKDDSKRTNAAVVAAVAASSYDVVIFCLLLSYMPTPRLRYRACLHAYLALKPGGLLVVISTRTQGARRSEWEEKWVRCLETIGFAQVHKQARKKIVILSFEKKLAEVEGGHGNQLNLESEATIQAWVEEKLLLPEAAQGLPIIADEHM